MKIYDPATQYEFEAVGGDGKLDDVGVLALIGDRLGATKLRHVTPPLG
jgi:hypothetical protein